MRLTISSRHLTLRLALAMFVVFGIAPRAMAFSVTPTVLEMTTSGDSRTAQIRVVNDGARALPVEIAITTLDLTENGETTTKPAGEEFLVFPPQALIPAGAAQNFRVQWVGDPQIKQSRSYVFAVNQVPVKMPAGKSGVQVVFSFTTIVNIAPSSGKSAINFVSAGIGKDDKGKPRPTVTVTNPGNLHAKLSDATIKLSGGAWSETLSPERLRQVMGLGLIQPGKTRKFILPVDMPASVSQVTASIDYRPAR